MAAEERTDADQARELIEDAMAATDPQEFNSALRQLADLIERSEEARQLVAETGHQFVSDLDDAKIGLAGVMAKLAAVTLVLAEPTVVHDGAAEMARGGPAGEIALAATHLLRYAGEVVPLDASEIDEALAAPDSDPDFGVYPAVFAAAVAHLYTAAYFVLDANDCHTALASAPPEQETFPPLPFPRIWIEMNHLVPYMRFIDSHTSGADRQLDLLGIGIAEIQQGRVWDMYVPFQFGDRAEFFFLAARITPGGIVQADSTLEAATLAFDVLRKLAVGGLHLLTARNVTTSEMAMPRHQRKRMQDDLGGRKPRLYYVDLAGAGEREPAAGSGTGGREYRVRWLVRGHWRHIDSGRSFCTCCQPAQIASWVEPYIKGPVGAPWKGRQVRRQTHTTSAAA